jgi:ribosomal protein S15P/S13E
VPKTKESKKSLTSSLREEKDAKNSKDPKKHKSVAVPSPSKSTSSRQSVRGGPAKPPDMAKLLKESKLIQDIQATLKQQSEVIDQNDIRTQQQFDVLNMSINSLRRRLDQEREDTKSDVMLLRENLSLLFTQRCNQIEKDLLGLRDDLASAQFDT